MAKKKSDRLMNAMFTVIHIDNMVSPLIPRPLKPLYPLEVMLNIATGTALIKEEKEAKLEKAIDEIVTN